VNHVTNDISSKAHCCLFNCYAVYDDVLVLVLACRVITKLSTGGR